MAAAPPQSSQGLPRGARAGRPQSWPPRTCRAREDRPLFRAGAARGLVTMQDDCQRRRDRSGKSRNAVIRFFLAGQSDAQRLPIGLIAVSGSGRPIWWPSGN